MIRILTKMVSFRMDVDDVFCDPCNEQLNVNYKDKVYPCSGDGNE